MQLIIHDYINMYIYGFVYVHIYIYKPTQCHENRRCNTCTYKLQYFQYVLYFENWSLILSIIAMFHVPNTTLTTRHMNLYNNVWKTRVFINALISR